MFITQKCRRMMAFVMTLALVLSVLFVSAPKEAKADDGVPSVEVLGATIRLDPSKDYDNNGKQSMMIGIRVNNANKASACAIRLTSGSRSYTIATDAAKYSGESGATQTTLHSKDTAANSIVYAVVITNIPEANYYSTISILGKVWDMNGNMYTSGTAEKNVMGVVDTIKSKYPGLNICILNGSLYKDAGTSKLSATDISGYSEDPDPEVTSNPLVTPAPTRVPAGENEWAVPFERINENSEGDIFYAPVDPSHQSCARTYDRYDDELLISNETTDAYADGLVVNLPAAEIAKRYTRVTINYEYLGSGSGVFGFKYSNPAGSTAFANNDSFKLSRSATSKVIDFDGEYMPVSKFYMICFSTDIAIRIKSIIFSNPKPDCSGAVDLSQGSVVLGAGDGADPTNPPTVYEDITNSTAVTYSSGEVTVNDGRTLTGRETTELLFDLPNNGTVDVDEQVAVVVTGSCTVPGFSGFRVRLADSTGDGAGSWASAYEPATSREFSEVFTLTATSTAYKVALKSPAWNGPTIQDLTITGVSVYWIGRGATAPTPMPSPSPTPEPTAVPTPTPLALVAYDTEAASALSYTEAVAWKVTTPIVADGTPDEVWDGIPYYSFRYHNTGDTRAMAKIAWDSNNLYVLVRVKDPGFDSTAGDNWNRDGGELFLDENNTKETTYDDNTDAFQYRLTGFDSQSTTTNGIASGSNAAKTAYAGIVAVPKFTTDGYVMEYMVPWSDPTTVDIGKRIGFELNAFDCSGGSRAQEIYFITTGGSLHSNPSLFGALSLASETGAAPTPVPTAVPTAPPAPLDLTRVTYDNSAFGHTENGVVYINDQSDDTTFVRFPFNTPVNSNEHITVVVEGWAESSNASFRMYVADGWDSGSNIVVNNLTAGYFRSVLTFTANDRDGNTWPELRIRGGNGVQTHIQGLEIEAVNVYYTDRGAVVPEAGPTPTPRATATPAPTPGPDYSRTFDLSLHDGDKIVTDNADGSITINDGGTNRASVVYFDLPGEVVPNETVTLIIKGTSTGACTRFRAWLGNGGDSYSVSIPNIDTPEGNFSATVTIKVKSGNTATRLTFKSSSWDGPPIKGITITEATIYYTDRGAVVPD